jgi:cyclic pyranopterin phosphate synthase
MSNEFTHLEHDGSVKMVDVSEKKPSVRIAVAEGYVKVGAVIITSLINHTVPKGNPLETAKIAGILAAKRTSDLIPLCHQLPLDNVKINFEVMADRILITATAKTRSATGVEMEALTAVSVAALTIYDMLKALSKEMEISDIRLISKSGGKSGEFHAKGRQ